MKCDDINLKGTFGIELESIRVAEDGHISKKEHPFMMLIYQRILQSARWNL